MLAVEPPLRTCENFPTAYMRLPHWTICRTRSTLPDGPVSTSWGVAAGVEDTAAPATPDGTVRNPKSRVAARMVTRRNRMSRPPQEVGSRDCRPSAGERLCPQCPPVCPQCPPEVAVRCDMHGKPHSSHMAVGCESYGSRLRAPSPDDPAAVQHRPAIPGMRGEG